jgi:hypothetical protein
VRTVLRTVVLVAGLNALVPPAYAAPIVLYTQDFEHPAAFVNDGGDVNIFNSVNTLYGNQPPGFTFEQAFTVETLLITGTQAFGTGYSDPSGTGGNYALGMLSSAQNDLVGLSFNVQGKDFLNVALDISSIDLSVFGGPFVPAGGAVPRFEFTLFDNPGGAPGLGGGTVLDTLQASGTKSAPSVFDWTHVILPLDASAATDGNVILSVDLLDGGYASLDNFRIAASDTPGEVGEVPEPSTLTLIALGLAAMRTTRGRRRLGSGRGSLDTELT